MKPSIALSVKSLVSKLHPPLPLNPRESQKLLNLLTTSFRQQLDSAHPNTATTNAAATAVASRPPRPSPTDAHIQSVLSSPLLKGVPGKVHEKHGADSVGALGRVQTSLCAPIEYFREQVATGEATLATAKYCLKVHLQNITTYRHGSSSDGSVKLDTSQAGATVLNWLWSSGLEDSMEFTYDGEFVKLLVTFLVAENKEYAIWRWFSRLKTTLDAQGTLNNDTVEPMRNLISALVRTWLRDRNPNAALAAFVKAVEACSDLPRESAAGILRAPGSQLGRYLLAQESDASLDSATYDRMLATSGIWCHEDSFVRAMLALGAPVPNPQVALQFIRKRPVTDLVVSTPAKRRSFVLICLRTSKLLLAQGQEDKALPLIAMVQKYFSAEVGVTTKATQNRERKRDSLDFGALSLLNSVAPA